METVASNGNTHTPVRRARDSQRSRVYTSEYMAWDWHRNGGRVFDDLNDTQAFCDRVCAAIGIPPVLVKNGAGRRNGIAHGVNAISLPLFSRYEAYALHELTHVWVARLYGRERRCANHGPEFCWLLLDLIGRFMSREHEDRLWDEFARAGVRVVKPEIETAPMRAMRALDKALA